MDVEATFGAERPVVGMVHLPPLPGAPRFDGDRAAVHERARRDAAALAEGGIDAVLVENFGDVPFHPEVPKHVVASMTAVAREIAGTVDCPLGVNVLRNDAAAAVSIAAAVGASFVRVNVHTGARVTDQGVLEGRAHETLRLHDRLGADVKLLADVDSKHSAPLAARGPETGTVADAIERGLADGLVVTGPATGREVDRDRLDAVVAARDAVDPDVPVFVGSGVTSETVEDLLEAADGVVVGTALKAEGTRSPVDPEAVAELVERVG